MMAIEHALVRCIVLFFPMPHIVMTNITLSQLTQMLRQLLRTRMTYTSP